MLITHKKNQRKEEIKMGYSIMTPFKDVNQKEKMERFLTLHFKSLDEILSKRKCKGYDLSGIAPYDDLAYGPKKNIPVLGYNYNSYGLSTDYYMFICFWMSVMNGKTKKIGNNTNIPYVLYDGSETFAIYANTPVINKNGNYIEVDEFGYRESLELQKLKSHPKILKIFEKSKTEELKEIDRIIHDELKRLTKEWKQFI
jgi:hypothetical protein